MSWAPPPAPPSPSQPHGTPPTGDGPSSGLVVRVAVAALVVIGVVVASVVVLTGAPLLAERADADWHLEEEERADEVPPVTTGEVPSSVGDAEPQGAPGPGEADPACPGTADGVLTIGGLLPQTGELSFLGPPADAGVRLAVDEINDAGGVLGQQVVYLPGDSGGLEEGRATATVDGHLDAHADVIVGALASGHSLAVVDRVAAACTLQVSPSNTSPVFTDYPDDDLYFRTSPSDVLQGQAVADLMIEDRVGSAAVLARGDAYGLSLLDFIRTPFEQQGGRLSDLVYEPDVTSFATQVDTIVNRAPDAVVVVGFDESSRILQSLFDAGITPDTTRIYLVDGNIGNALGSDFTQPGALAGIRGTLPSAEVTPQFLDRMLTIDPSLTEFSYGPESYDAVVVTALAAVAAGTDDPADVARHMIGVTRDGEPCDTFTACVALLAQGSDIDYDGPTGPLELDRSGEPSIASFAVLGYGADNQLDERAPEFRLAGQQPDG